MGVTASHSEKLDVLRRANKAKSRYMKWVTVQYISGYSRLSTADRNKKFQHYTSIQITTQNTIQGIFDNAAPSNNED